MVDYLFRLIKDIGKVTFATVLPIVHRCHEDTSTTLCCGTLPPQTLNLSIAIHLVVFQHRQFGLLALMLDLLRGGINLLLALLGATTKSKDEMEGGFLLDIVVGQGATVFKLLAGEDQSLLIGRDALLV